MKLLTNESAKAMQKCLSTFSLKENNADDLYFHAHILCNIVKIIDYLFYGHEAARRTNQEKIRQKIEPSDEHISLVKSFCTNPPQDQKPRLLSRLQ